VTLPLLRQVLLVGLASGLLSAALAKLVRAPDESLRELAARVAKEKDRVEVDVFDKIAAFGDERALAALEAAVERLATLEALTPAYRAFAAFAEAAPEVAEEARHFLSRETFRAKQQAARPVVVQSLLAFGDAALPALERALIEHKDAQVRQIVCDALVPRLAATGTLESLELLLDNASLDHVEGRTYLGLDEAARASYAGLRQREVVRSALERFPYEASAPALTAKLASQESSRAWKLLLIDYFATRGNEQATRTLAVAFSANDTAVVLEALARLVADGGAQGFVDEVSALVRSRDAAVRRAAVIALARLDLTRAEVQAMILGFAREKDDATRMGAAVALVELRTPEAREALHVLVSDGAWPVRSEALAQVARLRDKRSLPLLIERLDVEQGRLREDVYAALCMLAGQDLGRGSARWRRWWENEGAAFELPAAADLERREKARRERAEDEGGTRGPVFYGVEVFSERVCFVLDVSGSMRINAGPGVDPEGPQDPTRPSRMDVAKEQLAEIVRAFPDGKLFNLIFFESEVRALRPELVKMKKSMRQESLRFIREQYSLGGTALYPALQLAFADPLVDTIYLISDGAPTEGEITDIEEIRARVKVWNAARHVRIHGITIGQDSTLLRWLTEDTGGKYLRRD
jgi:HEAT repeat protein